MRIIVEDDQVICRRDRREPRHAVRDGYKPTARPVATVQRFIPNKLISNVKSILQKYDRVNIKHFRTYYRMEFKEVFCATDLGFDDGIEGFFEHLSDFVIMNQTDCSIILTLGLDAQMQSKTSSNHGMDSRGICKDSMAFFMLKRSLNKPRNRLLLQIPGLYDFTHLLAISDEDLLVPLSPFQNARQRDPKGFDAIVYRIRGVLPSDGLPLTELPAKTRIDLHLFGVGSIAEFTTEFNEIFYIVYPTTGQSSKSTCSDQTEESANETSSSSYNMQPILYDGFKNSYEFKTIATVGQIPEHWFYIVVKALCSGVYQKTIFLVRKAGVEGLRLGVFKEGFKLNFKRTNNPYEEELLKLSPIELFEALAAFRFFELKSNPSIKNDIRIFWKAEEVMYNFVDYLEASKLHSEKPEEVGIETDGLPQVCKRPQELTKFYKSVNEISIGNRN